HFPTKTNRALFTGVRALVRGAVEHRLERGDARAVVVVAAVLAHQVEVGASAEAIVELEALRLRQAGVRLLLAGLEDACAARVRAAAAVAGALLGAHRPCAIVEQRCVRDAILMSAIAHLDAVLIAVAGVRALKEREAFAVVVAVAIPLRASHGQAAGAWV